MIPFMEQSLKDKSMEISGFQGSRDGDQEMSVTIKDITGICVLMNLCVLIVMVV